MKNAIVKLGFCLLFFLTSYATFAATPTVTITRKAATPNPTTVNSVVFVVDWSVTVDGFGDNSSDYVFTGTAGTAAGVSASITATLTTKKKFEVTVTGMTVSGPVGLEIAANAVTAVSGGQANALSSEGVTFDYNGNPQPVISHPSTPDPTTGGTVLTFEIDFGETVDTDPDETMFDFSSSDASFSSLAVDAGSFIELTTNRKWSFTVTIAGEPDGGDQVKVKFLQNKVHDQYGNNNDVSNTDAVTWGGLVPDIADTPTVVVTSSTVEVFGEVLDDGGVSSATRGVVAKPGTTVTESDNRQTVAGGPVGTFSYQYTTGVTAATKYTAATWVKNGIGGSAAHYVLSNPITFWTLSSTPGSDSDITQIDVISATALDIHFDKFGSISGADGLVILRSTSPLTDNDLADGKAPTVANMPKLIAVITDGNQTLLHDPADVLVGTPALTGGTTYYYASVPFNWNGTDTETYNYREGFTDVSGTTKSATSQIKLNSAPAKIDYITQTGSGTITGLGNSINIGDFTLYDGDGITNDPDALPTNLQTLTVHVENWTMINHIAIYDNGTIHDEGTLDASGNITFTLSSGDLQSGDNNTGGGSPDQFNIVASFNAANVDEGAVIQVSITGATLFSGSSDLISPSAGGAHTDPATQNVIEVTATDYTYSGNPANVNANVTFGVTVTAVDANNHIDKNLTGNIVLSHVDMTPASSSVAVSTGVASFSGLKFADAGTKTIAVNSSTTGPMNKSFNIDINSLGVSPVGPASTLCVNTADADPLHPNTASFTDYGPIVIAESDKTDFSVGDHQSYSLLLPPNFVFDITSSPTLTKSATSDISNLVQLSYLGNNILRFEYKISAQTTKDVITIDHLKIKYIGTDTVKNQDILRVGGSANQLKNSDSDGKSHGQLTASSKTGPVIDFRNTNGGSIAPNETRFAMPNGVVTPIVLQGFIVAGPTDVDGVFVGEGVSKDIDNKYKFYPTSVGSRPVTFTYTDPASGCKTSITKTFVVYTSSINGLALTYCENATPAHLLGGTALPPDICFADPTPNTPYWKVAYYVYWDPRFGTWNPLGGSTTPGVNDVFDPSSSLYQDIYQYNTLDPFIFGTTGKYGIRIGYFITGNSTFCLYPFSFFWAADDIEILRAPTASITTRFDFVCSNAIPIQLSGRPSPKVGSTVDKFWVSAQGVPGDPDHPTIDAVTGDPATNFFFDPSLAITAGAGTKLLQVNYRYEGPNGCTDITSFPFTEFEQPDIVDPAIMDIDGVAVDIVNGNKLCETGTVKSVSASNPGGVLYNWYNAAGTTNLTTNSDDFDPNKYLDVDGDKKLDVGTKQFKITQTTNTVNGGKDFAGCESDPLQFTIQVIQAPVVKFTGNVKVCSGQDIILDDLGGSITQSLGGTWSTLPAVTPNVSFLDNGGSPDDSKATGRKYVPTTADKNAKGVTIVLTSDVPADHVCPAVSNSIFVPVNSSLAVTAPSPVTYCATTTSIFLTATVSNNGVQDLNAVVHWVTPNGLGTIPNPDAQTIEYQPSPGELASGGLINFTVATDDPDGTGPTGGPCTADTKPTTITINKRPLVDAGTTFKACSDGIIQMDGTKPPGSSAHSFTWSGGNGHFDDATAGNAIYTPDPATETTSNTSIVFTLTSDDADGVLGPCLPEQSQVIVNIFPKPSIPQLLDFPNPDPVNPLTPAPAYKYCVSDGLQDIKAFGPEGGDLTWYKDAALTLGTGTGVTFSPAAGNASTSAANTFSFWVTQTTNKVPGLVLGCQSAPQEVQLIVNPLPVPAFSAVNFCLNDAMQFTDLSTVPAGRTITGWSWDFADELTALDFGGQDVPVPPGTHGGATTGTFNNPVHVFAETGTYNVALTVVSSDGCKKTAAANTLPFNNLKAITVGDKPEADFSFLKICDGDGTVFKYEGTIKSQIDTWDWSFDDAASGSDNTSSIDGPVHTFTGVGSYNVTLTATTELGCFDVVTKKTNIVPYIKGQANFPYVENFESPNHGWFAEGKVTKDGVTSDETSWTLLTSAGSITADPALNAGSTFWATHTTADDGKAYFDNERSVLYGPCVDMSALKLPVIAIDYFNDTEPQGDGAYIEYMEVDEDDGTGTWVRLGDIDKGLEWYDHSSVGGLSLSNGIGQDVSQYGWSGSTEDVGWKTGRYNLDKLTDQTRLRFRIVFGSNQSLVNTDTYDGFAIDYFKLESRNRLVLVENFTSASSSADVANNTWGFKHFPSAAASKEVVKIEYHTGLPAAAGDPQDPIFAQNPMDPNARASFYGLSAVPRAYIDGYNENDGSADANGMFAKAAHTISPWADNYYGKESLRTSPISIKIDKPDLNDGVLTVKGKITSNELDLPAERYSLYIAITEEIVNGDTTYVLRKMLPSASGIKVPAMPKGTSFDFEESWSVDKAYLGDDPKLVTVAFVQSDIVNSNNERLVLQAAYNDEDLTISYTTGIETPYIEQTVMYPNPADKIVNIELPQPTSTGVEVNVMDQLGRSVIQSGIGIGQRSTAINTGELAPAVYIIQLKENGVQSSRKLVVTHGLR